MLVISVNSKVFLNKNQSHDKSAVGLSFRQIKKSASFRKRIFWSC